MIAQVEQYVKNGQFDEAKNLLPLLEQVFADNYELSIAVSSLETDISLHSQHSLETLQLIKEILVR